MTQHKSMHNINIGLHTQRITALEYDIYLYIYKHSAKLTHVFNMSAR